MQKKRYFKLSAFWADLLDYGTLILYIDAQGSGGFA